jgi:hypothetical protein
MSTPISNARSNAGRSVPAASPRRRGEQCGGRTLGSRISQMNTNPRPRPANQHEGSRSACDVSDFGRRGEGVLFLGVRWRGVRVACVSSSIGIGVRHARYLDRRHGHRRAAVGRDDREFPARLRLRRGSRRRNAAMRRGLPRTSPARRRSTRCGSGSNGSPICIRTCRARASRPRPSATPAGPRTGRHTFRR